MREKVNVKKTFLLITIKRSYISESENVGHVFIFYLFKKCE